MIGTGRELLYCISLRYGWHSKLTQVPRKTRNWWHFLIRRGTYGEELCELILPYFGAKKLRDCEIFPAIYIGPKGQKLDEVTLMETITSKRQWYVGFCCIDTARMYKTKDWKDMSTKCVGRVFNFYGWQLYKERQYNCSLWELKQEMDDRFAPVANFRMPYPRDVHKFGEMKVRVAWGNKHDYEKGHTIRKNKEE